MQGRCQPKNAGVCPLVIRFSVHCVFSWVWAPGRTGKTAGGEKNDGRNKNPLLRHRRSLSNRRAAVGTRSRPQWVRSLVMRSIPDLTGSAAFVAVGRVVGALNGTGRLWSMPVFFFCWGRARVCRRWERDAGLSGGGLRRSGSGRGVGSCGVVVDALVTSPARVSSTRHGSSHARIAE